MNKILNSNIYVNKNIIEKNKILQKTFFLLSATIFFSAASCLLAITTNKKPSILYMVLTFLILFLIDIIKNENIRLILVFAFTGMIGNNLGPILNSVLKAQNGEMVILFSLLTTGLSFLSLSFYTIIKRKNFQNLQGFIFIGFITAIFLLLVNLFFNINGIIIIYSSLISIISGAIILYTISNIINNEETDYISATVSLYLSIYNIFVSLISIFVNRN